MKLRLHYVWELGKEKKRQAAASSTWHSFDWLWNWISQNHNTRDFIFLLPFPSGLAMEESQQNHKVAEREREPEKSKQKGDELRICMEWTYNYKKRESDSCDRRRSVLFWAEPLVIIFFNPNLIYYILLK